MSNTAAQTPTITFVGKSRTEYTFHVYPIGTSFREAGGNYVFTRATPKVGGGGSHLVIYTGQTSDLSTRFDNHHKEECIKKAGATHICVRVCDDEKTRLAIEQDLIAAYNPACNG